MEIDNLNYQLGRFIKLFPFSKIFISQSSVFHGESLLRK